MVSVYDQTTTKTMENSNPQFYLTQHSTATTPLTGVAWVDLHHSPTSIFSFVGGIGHNLTPGSVSNGFGQAMIFQHPSDVQLFKDDNGEAIHQLSAFLMGKIAATIGDSLMNVSNYFAAFLTL